MDGWNTYLFIIWETVVPANNVTFHTDFDSFEMSFTCLHWIILSSHSSTFSVRVSVSTKAQSPTSSPIWRLWDFTVLPTTTLQTSVCSLHIYSVHQYILCKLRKTNWLHSICVEWRLSLFLIHSIPLCLPSFVSDSVIEVASGEYGDLNPVLFEAVQGGMCAIEEKKNQCDNNGPSVCATQYPRVCRRLCTGVLQFRLDYQQLSLGSQQRLHVKA